MKKIIGMILVIILSFEMTAFAENSKVSKYKMFDKVVSETIGTDFDNIEYGIICFPSEGVNRKAELDAEDIQNLISIYQKTEGRCILAPINTDFDSLSEPMTEEYPYFYIGISEKLPAEYWNWHRNVRMLRLCFGGVYDGAAIYGGYGRVKSTYNDGFSTALPINYVWYKPEGENTDKIVELGNELYNKYKDMAKPEGDYFGTRDEKYFSGYDATYNSFFSNVGCFEADGCSEWVYDILHKAASYNLIPYDTSTEYTSPITREEFCKLTANMLNMIPYGKYYDLFSNPDEYTVLSEKVRSSDANLDNIKYTDIKTLDESIKLLSGLGIVNGMGDGTFNPDGYITREQICAIYGRVFNIYTEFQKHFLSVEKSFGVDEPALYTDDDKISPWAYNDVYTMTKYNYINGMENGYFEPQNYCTLEQAITIISRVGNICYILRDLSRN